MASNKDKYKEIKKTCNEFYSEMDKFITCLLENYQFSKGVSDSDDVD